MTHTLTTPCVEDITILLGILQQIGSWTVMRLNFYKSKNIAYIQALKKIVKKNKDDALIRSKLANISPGGRPIGILTHDKPLPSGYLTAVHTTSLCPEAHLRWNKQPLDQIYSALVPLSTVDGSGWVHLLHIIGPCAFFF
jgi:hypothetical protein